MSGVVLRDYQDEAIDRVLKARDRGINKQLGVAATGLGKQAPLDEPVLTPTGWSVMGDLVPGSLVIGGDGCPVEVQSIHPQGIKPVVKVTFTDGSWTRCGPEHLWAARTKYDKYRDRPYRTMPTSALRPGWQIPLVAPVEFSTTDLPVDPYTLGVLLGDGSVGLPRLSVCTDRWIADHLGWTYLGDHSTSPYTVEGTIKDHDLVDGMKALSLWGKHSWEKHIPTPYLTAPAQDRLALLRGLLDADGYAMSSGGVEFCSTSENLVLSVAELVRSLGGVARNITSRITQYPHGGEKKNGRRSWRVNIKTSPGMNPFLLPRKADAWVPPTKYLPARVVRSVEADGPDVEQVCIKIANDDGLYVTRDYIVTHNTIVFCSLAMQLNVPTLILAHRDELISQAVEKLLLVWPEADVGVVKAERNEINHQVVVASVQSLRKPRLAKMARDMFDGGLIITDEAHHATATSYRNVYEHFGCGNPGGPLHLGVTATPDRGDGGGLNAIYEEITFTYDLLWGIQRGYLADLKGLRIQLKDVDFTQARISQGDYAAGDVGQMLENADAPDLIAAAWLEHASDRKTLIFTPTVATAEATAESFISMGVEAAVVSAKTPLDERRLMLKRFAAGELRVIANCGVLTEGFDDPAVNCIVVARPTKSRALYAQIVGRGSRKHPAKSDCILEGQRVLTDAGLVPIESVTTQMKVWDGVEFVDHEGAICKGMQPVVSYAGLTATPDHKVWTAEGWKPLGECQAQEQLVAATGAEGHPLREADGYYRGDPSPQRTTGRRDHLFGVWGHAGPVDRRHQERASQLPIVHPEGAWNDPPLVEESVFVGQGPMHQSQQLAVRGLRRTGDHLRLPIGLSHGVLDPRGSRSSSRVADRSGRQQQGVLSVEPEAVYAHSEHGEQSSRSAWSSVPRLPYDPPRSALRGLHPETTSVVGADVRRNRGPLPRAIEQAQGRVWDLLNAGPRHRFTVEGLLVSNCLVMDVCGASDENSLLSVPSLFGIEPKDKEKFDASEETIGEFIFAMEKEKVRRGEMQAKAIDLFQKVIDSPINWVHFTARSGLKTYAINLGSKDAGSIVIDHLGGDDERQWHCYLRWDRGVTPTGDDIATFANGDSYRTLIREVDLEMAQGVGEDYVRKNGVSALTNKNAAWRDRPPTEKQLASAAKWKIVVGDGWTAGQLSSAIDEKAQASKHRSKDQAPRKPPPSWVNKNR